MFILSKKENGMMDVKHSCLKIMMIIITIIIIQTITMTSIKILCNILTADNDKIDKVKTK